MHLAEQRLAREMLINKERVEYLREHPGTGHVHLDASAVAAMLTAQPDPENWVPFGSPETLTPEEKFLANERARRSMPTRGPEVIEVGFSDGKWGTRSR